MKPHSFSITQTPGRCGWCGCTDDHACAEGCSWANPLRTLCSACVPLDKALRTKHGRSELAEFLQEQGFLRPRSYLAKEGTR